MSLALSFCVGCAGSRSASPASEGARTASRIPIDAALFDDHAALARSAAPQRPIPALHEPAHIRSCCAFGFNLQVNLGAVPVPLYRLRTVRGIDDLGPHDYAAGLVQFTPSPARRRGEKPRFENTGMVYTCRGGFVDIGHLRDHADRTLFFASRIEPLLESGGVIELGDFGGGRRVLLKPVSGKRIAAIGRRRLAVATAQWVAMQVSIWHEIGSWYGNSNVPFFPEKLSSFSMEDLYSNLVGTKLAAGIILTASPADEIEYDRAMTEWLRAALRRLDIVSKEDASDAMNALDGIWWDSTRRLPDWKIVRRRKLDLGPTLKPWLVSMAFDPQPGPEVGCDEDPEPLALRFPDRLDEVRFSSHASLEIVVSENLASNGFPLPRARSRRITQADFPAIVEKIRSELNAELGVPSDHPHR